MTNRNLYIERMSMALLTAEELERLNLPNKRTDPVWILDPERRAGRVHRADGSSALLADSDAFDGEDVLPGFRFTVSDALR